MHSNWRDCQAWRQAGLEMSTTSNEAAKLYDATLTQYIGWYDDASVGGIESSCAKLLEADPDFAMGHVLVNGLDVMGTGRSPKLDPEFKDALDKMAAMANRGDISKRERLHIKAMDTFSKGYQSKAAMMWDDILVDSPTDMLAMKFAHDTYFYLSQQSQLRDSIARIMPHCKPSMPLYGYLLGMHSFGLVETNFYAEAERVAAKGLELNRKDAWSTHSMAHVLEMTGRQKEGIKFMSSTVNDWSFCGMLASHNFWHWALHHIELGEYQGALDIFDAEIGVRLLKGGTIFDIVDASSLLFRLELEGVDVGNRWNDVYEVCRPHTDDHLLVFNDCHILLSCLGAKQEATTKKLMDSIEHFIRDAEGTQRDLLKGVGTNLCQAFIAYDAGDFAKAVDLLVPIKYDIINIGGSNAQRDLFNLFFINAALKSPSQKHHKLARQLLSERKCMKQSAPMTDRLIARAMAQHAY